MPPKEILQAAPVYAGPRVDPRTKLFMLLLTNVLVLSGKTAGGALFARPFVVGVLCLLLFLAGRRAAGLGFAVFFAASWVVELCFFDAMTGMGGMLVLLVTAMGYRWLPAGMAVYYLLCTTRVSEFVAAMQAMRVPRQITIPLSVMFRFFPTIRQEARSIDGAMRMRGVGRVSAGRSPVEMVEYRLIPLMMSAAKIGDELSASAMTRGLGGEEKRTSLCRIRLGRVDAALFAAFTAAIVLYIAI